VFWFAGVSATLVHHHHCFGLLGYLAIGLRALFRAGHVRAACWFSFFLLPAVSLDFDFGLIWVFWKQSQQLSRLTAALVLIVGLLSA
jgi:hypothetical protein